MKRAREWVVGCAYFAVYVIALVLAVFALPFSAKLRRGLRGRLGLTGRVRRWRNSIRVDPYWFHFASSGELEQCLPILDALKRREPKAKIFLSYFSPTAARALALERDRRLKAGKSIPWDGADFAPFDVRPACDAYVKVLTPKAFVAVNRELWPALVDSLRRAKVRHLLFAAYFSPSARRSFFLYREQLASFDYVGATESSSTDFLLGALPGVRVEAGGDPRLERVIARREMAQESRYSRWLVGRPIFIAASLWPEDFEALAPALAHALERHPTWRPILVPHEPHAPFVAKLLQWLEAQGQSPKAWSEWQSSPDATSALVVDGVGWLAELYRVADLVFVGGSFKKRVHNVLEPAAYGKAIVTGPFIQNSGEATEMARLATGLVSVADGAALADTLDRLMSDTSYRETQSGLALDYVRQRQGAAERYVDCLLGAR